MRPCSDVICPAGSTISTARIGTAYISAWPIPARPIATGISRRGLVISSAAGGGQLDPDERVEQHRDDGDEHRRGTG